MRIMIPTPPPPKRRTPPKGTRQPEQPEAEEHVERDDYLEKDALDAHGHGEQPEGERETDLTGTPATHGKDE